jgi:cytochrome c oxidase subunit 3
VVYGEGSLPSFSVAEVQAGFKSHPDILIRTEVLTAEKQKTILSRKESELRLSDARYVVEGANLKEMNTVVSYLLISFFITDFMDFTFFQV